MYLEKDLHLGDRGFFGEKKKPTKDINSDNP